MFFLTRDGEARRIGRMNAERSLREGVDSIVRRMQTQKRRREWHTCTNLGLRVEPNARRHLESQPVLSLRVRCSRERRGSDIHRTHKHRRHRDSHTPGLGLCPIVMRTNNAHFNVAPRTLSLEPIAFGQSFMRQHRMASYKII